ncbi:hypothetical protein B0E33_25295 [Roseibium algicola]|uniref:Uncharacterized protein n=1 Tax=Roseibium algicola TaxID=2857014 RepID=A0ABN4X3H1_9HYPH|nr:hypothetical protein [Roseibium aggregatum]AQQ06488.1 hypothetical protein B0E33_25295 [Roseibium aggregatum]
MDQEWMKLQELSNRINNVCKPAWENILIKTGSSYVNADEAVRKLLPKGYDTEPGWAWTALKATMKGPLAAVITNPVAAGIATFYIIDAVKGEKEPLPSPPQFDTDPQKYLQYIKFHYNLVYISSTQKILKMQEAARTGGSVNIEQLRRSLERSPFAHVPRGYKSFKHDKLEENIEAGLWAIWLTNLSSDHKLEQVSRAMGEDDRHNASGAARKSDGKYRHHLWQRLKDLGAFDRAYSGGVKKRDNAKSTDGFMGSGTPSYEYEFWLKIARDFWAKNQSPTEMFYIALEEPAAELAFRNAMRTFESQDFTHRMSAFLSPSWSKIRDIVGTGKGGKN